MGKENYRKDYQIPLANLAHGAVQPVADAVQGAALEKQEEKGKKFQHKYFNLSESVLPL